MRHFSRASISRWPNPGSIDTRRRTRSSLGTRPSAGMPPSACAACPRCSIRRQSRGSSPSARASTRSRRRSHAVRAGHCGCIAPDGTLVVAGGASRAEPTPAATVLKVRPDGPNVVTGDVVLAGAKTGDTRSRITLVLCRCGASRNKPFCDGTHTRIGFRDPGVLPADTASGPRSIGRVTVTPTRNGPLDVSGPARRRRRGRAGRLQRRDWLCRCGHSRTKPFCDRSHEKVGFIG